MWTGVRVSPRTLTSRTALLAPHQGYKIVCLALAEITTGGSPVGRQTCQRSLTLNAQCCKCYKKGFVATAYFLPQKCAANENHAIKSRLQLQHFEHLDAAAPPIGLLEKDLS
jgi:hypothetical protein